MATYKVSYKVLAKQGEELKATAKLIDGYAERVNQIRGKLGEDKMLAEVRNNLQKLNTQLVESRAVLNTAGGLLTSTVEKYTSVETRQVKKVDNLKAHNRDFYKNPVVVASAGGAAAGAAAASTAVPPVTTVNYTETTTVNYAQTTVVAAEPVVSAPATVVEAAPSVVNTAAPAAVPAAAKAGVGNIAGIAAGVGVAGGAIGAGAVLGVKHLIDEDKKDKTTQPGAVRNPAVKMPTAQKKDTDNSGGYDPEAELAAALERVRNLEQEE